MTLHTTDQHSESAASGMQNAQDARVPLLVEIEHLIARTRRVGQAQTEVTVDCWLAVQHIRERLDWYEAREPLVRKLRDEFHNVVTSEWSTNDANRECAFFDTWEQKNPKPKP